MKNHYIYIIINNINNKKYIGKRSCNCPIEEDKYMGSGVYLHRAYKKYGKENFTKYIMHICKDEQQALEYEESIIDTLDCINSNEYYNIAKGGLGGQKGIKRSDETKRKISIANQGNKNMLGKSHSEKTKKKISIAHKGKTLSEETRRKISENNGTKRPEVRRKLSIANKGLNNPMYGKSNKWGHHSEKTRKKISENHAKYWLGKTLSEEIKKKISKAKQGSNNSQAKQCTIIIDNTIETKLTRKELIQHIEQKYSIKGVKCWFDPKRSIPKKYIHRVSFVQLGDKILYDTRENK